MADLAYIAVKGGWLYLAVVMDAYSRRIIGWSMKRRADSLLAQNALKMALMRRQNQELLVHHSDRGYQKLLADNRIRPSTEQSHQNILTTEGRVDTALQHRGHRVFFAYPRKKW